jgi:DNA-binding MarR family transcriptional regulator
MDSIFFGLKRGHWVAVRCGKEMLEPYASFGVTPARFDLMYALQGTGMRQSALQRVLGVARSTVSRMLRSMEQRGLVERGHVDNKSLMVWLSDIGRALLRSAMKRLCGPGSEPYQRCTKALYPGPTDEAVDARGGMEGLLELFRGAFGDRATLHHVWIYDD